MLGEQPVSWSSTLAAAPLASFVSRHGLRGVCAGRLEPGGGSGCARLGVRGHLQVMRGAAALGTGSPAVEVSDVERWRSGMRLLGVVLGWGSESSRSTPAMP